MIALALACRTKLLLADKPTTALGATVQAQILLRLRRLKKRARYGMIFFTHSLGVAGEIADRVAVMYAGRYGEVGKVEEVMKRPFHPYTQGLMGSTVQAGLRGMRLAAIPSTPSDLSCLPPGCASAPRCAFAETVCRERVPEETHLPPRHRARCIRVAA